MAYGDLTTLADVKAWLQTGQSAFPPTDDALLTRLITAASDYIQTWLNRPIALADYLEVRDGSGGQRLQFACFPVSAVLSLTVDGLSIPPAPPVSPSTGLTAGYIFSPTQLALRGYYFTRRVQNVVVSYTAGYASIPPEIAQACIELVALRYRERTRVGEVSKAFAGAETVSYSQKDMSASVATLLQRYLAVAPIAGSSVMMAPTATDPATLVAAL
jgi:Phage gp6-like head-tail connector protein